MGLAPHVPALVASKLESFLVSASTVVRPSLCPEIQLWLAADLPTFWRQQEEWLGTVGLPPPYWGVSWPGGQALARYILDNPALVSGRTVLDLGTGSGLCAIAAALAGARVTAADIDPAACSAVALNTELNRVTVSIVNADPIQGESHWDVVLGADLWYERFMADRVTAWLRNLAGRGTDVFLGDLGRAYFPRHGVIERDRFRIEAAGVHERASRIDVCAWHLEATSRLAARTRHLANCA
jgi:predicted nicotinamide N-methyase